jgi:hypothetical protein
MGSTKQAAEAFHEATSRFQANGMSEEVQRTRNIENAP